MSFLAVLFLSNAGKITLEQEGFWGPLHLVRCEKNFRGNPVSLEWKDRDAESKNEAVLFLTDKPIKAQAIARIVNTDVQLVRQALLELMHDYEERNGGLEIADDEGYMIQVKDQFSSIVDEFAPLEMPVSLLRTLSAIAIKQPVAQSEIIKIRGAGAYDHIKELVERELIIKKEEGGRSPQLSTTKQFQEYFRLSHDAKSLRLQLRKQDKLQTPAGDADPAAEVPATEVPSPDRLEQIFAASPDASLVFRHDQGPIASDDNEHSSKSVP